MCKSTHLYVGVYALVFEATGAKVYDFDVTFVRLLQQNVLRLQVAVNNLRRSSTRQDFPLLRAARVTFSCLRYRRLTSICSAKRRISDRVNPWNLLFLMNSYLKQRHE
jgi:hypothetical protein